MASRPSRHDPGAVRRRALTLAAAASVLVATLAGLPPVAHAAAPVERLVPSQIATIQGAIDASSAGDTVTVAPGTYHEHIDFKGKAIEVRSAAGPATTTIDGDGTDHVVVFASGEGRSSVLRGFTITDGLILRYLGGGGVAITNASPTVTGNVITGSDALGHLGAGIGALGGSPLIEGNHIIGNHASANGAGGGLFAAGGAEIVGNVIEGNTAGGAGGAFLFGAVRFTNNVVRNNHAVAYPGGGLSIGSSTDYPGQPLVQQNLIRANVAQRGGGVAWNATGTSVPKIVHNTIVGNQALHGSAIEAESDGAELTGNIIAGPAGSSTVECMGNAVQLTVFAHNDVYGGGTTTYAGCPDATSAHGNISADPRFVDPSGADYRLRTGSPAIDRGDPSLAVPLTDLGGSPRVTDGDGDGTAVVDMGAYEVPAAHRPQMPYTVWTQPTGAPLDGIGSWVDVLTEPVMTTGQLPPAYLYGQYFGFVNGNGALGVLGLVASPASKSVAFGVVEANGTEHSVSIPFDWQVGVPYFPLVHQAGAGVWAAWVFDSNAGSWTYVGLLNLPAAWGKLAPASITAVPWLGVVAGSCAEYADTDVLVYPPVGYVGATIAQATATTNGTGPGDCPPVTTTVGPWTRYQMGA